MEKQKSWKLILRLFGFAKSYRWTIVLTVIAMMLYAALSAAPLFLLQPLFDRVSVEVLGNMPTPKTSFNPFNPLLKNVSLENLLYVISLILLPLIILIASFDYLKEYLYRFITLKVIIDIRNTLCRHILSLSLGFFNEKKAGDLMSRLTNDVSITQYALEFLFGDIIQQPLRILAILTGMFMINWAATLIIILFLPLFLFPILKLGRKVRKSRSGSLIKLGDVTESMHQMFSGIRVVKSFRMEDEEIKEFAHENKGFFRKAMGVSRAKALSSSIIILISGLGLWLAVVLGGYLVNNNYISFSSAGTILVFLMLLPTPMRMLAKSFNILQESLSGAERVFELMDLKPDIKEDPNALELKGIKQGINFNDISFAYPTAPNDKTNNLVLKDINLSVKPGEMIAIVGPTGAGKSTLLDLLARFYDPTKGSITIDNIDLRKIKRESLIDHLAIVAQENFLFNTTIRENICYGKRDATDEEIHQSARSANIHDFIIGLEKGYQTLAGERGTKLSGGERQRIAIARAILKNPLILLLDEATSALDTKAERAVQTALNNLMTGRTTFVIAHRLSTVQNADRIIVLENGRIAESGQHQDLLNRQGLYAKLYQLQFEQ